MSPFHGRHGSRFAGNLRRVVGLLLGSSDGSRRPAPNYSKTAAGWPHGLADYRDCSLFQFQYEPKFWSNGWACISAGIPIGVLAAVPYWLVLRRGAILFPSLTGAATGLLAGLVGTTVLEMHCPDLNAWHILGSHLGVSVFCAIAGLVKGLAAEITGSRSVG